MSKQPVPLFAASLIKREGTEAQRALSQPEEPTTNIKYVTRQVLPEEKYLDGMSAILRRDFFPDLSRLEAEETYLDALERADLVSLRAAAQRYIQATRPQQDEGSGPVPGLEEYRAQFTSEDNQSFSDLLERENQVKRKRFERVYGGPALIKGDPSGRLLLMPSEVDSFMIDHDRQQRTRKRIITSNTRIRPDNQAGCVVDGEDGDEIAVYEAIMRSYSRDEDADEARSVSSTSSAAFEFVPMTPLVSSNDKKADYQGQETPQRSAHTPSPYRLPSASQRDRLAQSMGGVSDTAAGHPSASVRGAKSQALKNILKAAVGENKDAPFHFETRLTRNAKRKTDDSISAVLNTPIISRTPSRTPHRSLPSTPTPELNPSVKYVSRPSK